MIIKSIMRLPRIRIIHPLFIAVFPVLSYFSHNAWYVKLNVLFIPLLSTALLVFVLYFLIKKFIKSKYKAGILVSLIAIFFFSYGHLSNLLGQKSIIKYGLFEDYKLLPFYIIVFGFLAIYVAMSKRNLLKTTHFLNIISVILIVMPIVSTLHLYYQRIGLENLSKNINTNTFVNPKSQTAPEDLPDIYYIIFERYAGDIELKKHFHFDNKDFTGFLQQKGFYIARDSRSNYLTTYLSLASSLNMDYLDGYIKDVNKESTDRTPLDNLIINNKILLYLKNKGYKYVHIGSPWVPTIKNDLADVSYIYQDTLLTNEFYEKLSETTILAPLRRILYKDQDTKYRNDHRTLIMNQIKAIEKLSKVEGPKFVFAHLFITHFPFVFDQNGNPIKEKDITKYSYEEQYIYQLIDANRKFKHMIETILSNSQKDPIIIIQADEGPYPENIAIVQYYFNLRNATTDQLKLKSSIINAYHLPNSNYSELYPAITPVNTFRLIFNLYFGENYSFLPDRVFGHELFDKPYKIFEITDLVK